MMLDHVSGHISEFWVLFSVESPMQYWYTCTNVQVFRKTSRTAHSDWKSILHIITNSDLLTRAKLAGLPFVFLLALLSPVNG